MPLNETELGPVNEPAKRKKLLDKIEASETKEGASGVFLDDMNFGCTSNPPYQACEEKEREQYALLIEELRTKFPGFIISFNNHYHDYAGYLTETAKGEIEINVGAGSEQFRKAVEKTTLIHQEGGVATAQFETKTKAHYEGYIKFAKELAIKYATHVTLGGGQRLQSTKQLQKKKALSAASKKKA
jgi:hypothetical protein